MQSLGPAGPLMVLIQDDPTFPSGVRSVVYDDSLERSFHLRIEAVATLLRFEGGREARRVARGGRDGVGDGGGGTPAAGLRLAGTAAKGDALPAWQPGCGSKSLDPGVQEAL